MPNLPRVLRKLGRTARPRAGGSGGGVTPPSPTFSTTVQVTRTPDKVIIPQGGSVVLTYTISGSGTTTATLVRTDGTAPVSLTCDGASHTVTFSPFWSQLYYIAASDDNGVVLDRLEIIVRHNLTASDPTASPTITTQRDGLWTDSDPATSPWPGGVLPGVNDIVSNAHTVKVNARRDGSGNVLQCARFVNESGGVLRIWNDNGTAAALWLTDYHGKAGSTFDMDGTFDATTASVLLMRNRPFHSNDTAGNSPDGFSHFWNAFYVKDGDVRMRGSDSTPFVRVTGHLTAGDTHIDLLYPVTNWPMGSVVIVPDTRGYRPGALASTNHGEVHIVRGVGPDGGGNADRRVYLMRALAYDHPAATDVSGSISVRPWDRNGDPTSEPLTPHILGMHSNCAVITEDPTGITGAYAGGQPRAHIMFQGGGRVDCRNALIGHGSGRINAADIFADSGGSWANPGIALGVVPKYYRCFPVLTYDLHGPAGGLGYDSSVDEPEFQPGNPRNLFGLNGPSHRFVNCKTMEPYVDAGSGADQNLGETPLAIGGIAHIKTVYGLYKGCTAYNFSGTCWLVPDGETVRNVFTGCVVARCDGGGARIDLNNLAFQGSGWVWGSYANWFRNSVCADVGGHRELEGQYGHSWINIAHTAKIPNSQGVSQLDTANCTSFDNRLAAVLQWDNIEAYGGPRHVGIYLLGTDQNFVPTSSVYQTLSRETAWAFYEIGMIPYGQYRVIKDRWFIRNPYHFQTYWQGGTDYQTTELIYKDVDCEGPSIFVAASADMQYQADGDLPDPGGPGRLVVSGGRLCIDIGCQLLYYFGTQGLAYRYFGHHYIFGGERTGTFTSGVTLTSASGGTAVYFYNAYDDYPNFVYNKAWNLCSPHLIEVNRVGGRNYDVYMDVQDPTALLPKSADLSATGTPGAPTAGMPTSFGTDRTWGAPELGKTNQYCHDKYLPLPPHVADVTLARYLGELKPGGVNSATDGLCWGQRLTPNTATTQSWLNGTRGSSSIKADDVGASG